VSPIPPDAVRALAVALGPSWPDERRPMMRVVGRWGDLVLDQVDGSTFRLSRVRRSGRRVASAWKYIPASRDPGTAERAAAGLEALLGDLRADDPISDTLEALARMGLRRGSRTPQRWFRRDLDGRVVTTSGHDRQPRLPADHTEGWLRDGRLVLRVEHLYGNRPVPAGEVSDPPWRELPEGVSWYYPGAAHALLLWHPAIDSELRPWLDQRFGAVPVAPPNLTPLRKLVWQARGAEGWSGRVLVASKAARDPAVRAAYLASPLEGDAVLRDLATVRGMSGHVRTLRDSLRRGGP
jgi:hypothetical protein